MREKQAVYRSRLRLWMVFLDAGIAYVFGDRQGILIALVGEAIGVL